ncbi:phosphatase PAP2 family protein [Haliovirga abyssi]|uniref:Phosphatidic acid phosphatase type 2/haloperoxidase domain-containing protein n=1 Tax=Haliovirga abyssi TaxID=2996794 RepID=A0AAU9D287_9FUSO|nr:phosphatase PAP2 family protein [Haliovirga abyssi]BDU50104.1 hypothetical protein HLVA_06730 [Haliovirga abyssi]
MKKTVSLIFLLLFTHMFSYEFNYEKKMVNYDYNKLKSINLKLDKKLVYTSGGVLAGSFLLDETIRRVVKKNKNSFSDNYFETMNIFGGDYAILLLMGTYGSSILTQDEKLRKTSFTSIESLTVAGTLTLGVKMLLGRARPYMDKGAFEFKSILNFGTDYWAFPSGHSTVAWAIFTPYAEEYSKWIYIIPASVSLARVYKDRHWSSDVIAGGLIGFSVGYILHKWNNNIKFTGNGIKIEF